MSHSEENKPSTAPTMFQLSSDPSFHFELVRALGLASYEGADIGEVLTAAAQITPGDFESWTTAFETLASRVQSEAAAIDAAKHPVSARNAFFRAASYHRCADFFTHGNWEDPRINATWEKHAVAFDKAMALLPTPGERVTIQADGFTVPAIYFGSGLSGPRPTILMCTGYDGFQEELYHVVGEAALQRGINVLTFEGPGQPTVRRQQNLGFIIEWEKVITPVVDYLLTRKDVDPKALGLWGYSLGGLFVTRAAAFEHRLAAVFVVDALTDFSVPITNAIPPPLKQLLDSGNKAAFDEAIFAALKHPEAPTSFRWGVPHGLWCYNIKSPFDWVQAVKEFRLGEHVHSIKTPMFVAEAEKDHMVPGQGERLVESLGDLATFHLFTAEAGAGEHCSVGASVLQNQVALDWFQDIVSKL